VIWFGAAEGAGEVVLRSWAAGALLHALRKERLAAVLNGEPDFDIRPSL